MKKYVIFIPIKTPVFLKETRYFAMFVFPLIKNNFPFAPRGVILRGMKRNLYMRLLMRKKNKSKPWRRGKRGRPIGGSYFARDETFDRALHVLLRLERTMREFNKRMQKKSN